MKLVVFPEDLDQRRTQVLWMALSDPVLVQMLLFAHSREGPYGRECYGTITLDYRPRFVLPAGWQVRPSGLDVVRTEGRLDLSSLGRDPQADRWLVIANGRYAAFVNTGLVEGLLDSTRASVVAIKASQSLMGYHEGMVTDGGLVLGFRRFYEDGLEPAQIPDCWPDYLLIHQRSMQRLIGDGPLPTDFAGIRERLTRLDLPAVCYQVAGLSLDMTSQEGLLGLLEYISRYYDHCPPGWRLLRGPVRYNGNARVVGKVWLGPGVWLGEQVVVVGPSIIGNCARLEQASSVIGSIVGQHAVVEPGSCIRHRVLTYQDETSRGGSPDLPAQILLPDRRYIRWPWYAYPQLPKRIVDVVVSILVLILFAPIIPIIAVAIKLDSDGPILFRDRREGRYGRPFSCLKFRSMKVGAEQIQDALRQVSEVDGPQFKIADDPRITRVGRFLRETYLDELPQFLNVLAGQMSVVGPRPSPRAENTLCPYWRYLRLSVRPGVTGLWQVRRTRQQGRDFQEWIEYDTQYVRDISPWLDIKICWQTLVRMVRKFIDQF